MAFIDWSDDYSVGIESIDLQHKKLVNLINALDAVVEKGGSPDVLVKIFSGLVAYVDEHFAHEEDLFTKAGWAGAAEHKQAHQRLIVEVSSFRADLDSGSNTGSMRLLKFLRDWLTNHIMRSDMEFAEALKARGLG